MATFMFEVYYSCPEKPSLAAELLYIVEKHGGWLDCVERENKYTICLTYEFNEVENSKLAAAEIRSQGNYVEGLGQYT